MPNTGLLLSKPFLASNMSWMTKGISPGRRGSQPTNKGSQPAVDGGHQWTTKGSGLQCTGCQCRANMHVKYEQLLQYRTEACPLAGTPLPKGGAVTEGSTKADVLQQMLDGSLPDSGGHELEIKKNYVTWRCGQMILRHSSINKLSIFARKVCWNEEWHPPLTWQGHLAHKLWRKGNKVVCTQCGGHCGGHALCSEQG